MKKKVSWNLLTFKNCSEKVAVEENEKTNYRSGREYFQGTLKVFFFKYIKIKPKPLETQHTENKMFLKSKRLK